ncbi:DNA-binding transcriptional LysR family regulator [Mesocricetibacter intestinalis]|uniref:DNA-binding transcriptional LysR family regulator n=1 Tax=Mesocricetibacter intestinalis TaxID=1521930 RepID=A0A4R6VAE6_9PAST|nr:LysR family transcriptional regulator [Mesocricetibacter intestinalis]TDQ56675.1 DNA-binding transcriptional LysR family regulator [Mesocricetibacter intestinalis]
MLDKLEALKVFCITAETLQFKQTANILSVSPPVITRVIAELEEYLGEPLFRRNTRQIHLTEFGADFLPHAKQLLAQSDELFSQAKHYREEDIKGTVRIAFPDVPFNEAVLQELLERLSAYPELVLDWRVSAQRLNVVHAQIDLGLRVGFAVDSRLIMRRIGYMRERIVAAPELIAKLGMPKDLQDLQKRYPLAGLIDRNTGRAWVWNISEQQQFVPHEYAFVSDDQHLNLGAALAGKAVAQAGDWLCADYLARGELVELFADMPKLPWPACLYRNQTLVTSPRVRLVFDLLADILPKYFSQ